MFTLLTTTPNVHFCHEARKKFPKVKIISPKEVSVPLAGMNGLLYPRNLALDYNDDDLLIIEQWEESGGVLVPRTTIEAFRDKRQQFFTLQKLDFPIIPTIDINSRNSLLNFMEGQSEENFILKPRRGAKGKGVVNLPFRELMKTTDLLRELGDTRFIVSPYIQHNEEIRLMFSGTELLGCISKGKGYSDWKKINPPDELTKLLETLFQYKFALWAIDFLFTGRDFKVLELNLNPGIDHFTQVTGINPLDRLNLSH